MTLENEQCPICGYHHSELYDEDAHTLVNALLNAEHDVTFKLEGGGVNKLGAEILLKHALKYLEASK